MVYCREETLAEAGEKLAQFVCGVGQIPVYLRDDALVISDNGDIYGTLAGLFERSRESSVSNV